MLTPPSDGPVVLSLKKASDAPPALPVAPASWTFTLKRDGETLSLLGLEGPRCGARRWRDGQVTGPAVVSVGA